MGFAVGDTKYGYSYCNGAPVLCASRCELHDYNFQSTGLSLPNTSGDCYQYEYLPYCDSTSTLPYLTVLWILYGNVVDFSFLFSLYVSDLLNVTQKYLTVTHTTRTRLGSCTGDLRSCANVPSMGGPTLFLNVVLCLFWQHQFGSNGRNPGERCFMGAATVGKIGHFRQGRTRAYEHRLGPNSVRSLTENQPCSPLRLGKAYKVPGRTF